MPLKMDRKGSDWNFDFRKCASTILFSCIAYSPRSTELFLARTGFDFRERPKFGNNEYDKNKLSLSLKYIPTMFSFTQFGTVYNECAAGQLDFF